MALRKKISIDNVDRQILNILTQDNNISQAEVAKRIYVSAATVHVRMKRLLRLGLIQSGGLKLNYPQIGYDICVFVGILLEKTTLQSSVMNELDKVIEVVNAHHTAGIYSVLAKIICRDTEHLRQVLHQKIQNIAGIQRIETLISLEEVINRPVILLEEQDWEEEED
jgi:Lrp/AsnC family transcriptional regulator, regulator for asnA, asnC and gidA